MLSVSYAQASCSCVTVGGKSEVLINWFAGIATVRQVTSRRISVGVTEKLSKISSRESALYVRKSSSRRLVMIPAGQSVAAVSSLTLRIDSACLTSSNTTFCYFFSHTTNFRSIIPESSFFCFRLPSSTSML